MGSIISHITDIINEYGSYENYLKETSMDERKIDLAVDQKLEIDLSDRQAFIIIIDGEGIKFLALIGSD